MQPGKKLALAVALAVLAASWIAPPWPLQQAMHGSLTVLGLAALLWVDRRWPLLTGHFALVCLFIAVHSVAAHWLYSNLPHDDWAVALTGWSPQQAFGWQRNHSDRLVHFLYGLCLTPALRQHLGQRWPRLSQRQAFALAAMLVICSSPAYEWLEWAIALLLAPAATETYNGQQGYAWDPHGDMLLASLGALTAWPRPSGAASAAHRATA